METVITKNGVIVHQSCGNKNDKHEHFTMVADSSAGRACTWSSQGFPDAISATLTFGPGGFLDECSCLLQLLNDLKIHYYCTGIELCSRIGGIGEGY
jgi:hypothetical protein